MVIRCLLCSGEEKPGVVEPGFFFGGVSHAWNWHRANLRALPLRLERRRGPAEPVVHRDPFDRVGQLFDQDARHIRAVECT